MYKEDFFQLCVCVFLPLAIVLITSIKRMYQNKQMANVLNKAIERGNVDISQLVDLVRKPRRTPREILVRRLLTGCITSLSGLLLIIFGLVSWATGSDFSADPVCVPMVFGSISLAVGISFLIVYFMTRRQGSDDQN